MAVKITKISVSGIRTLDDLTLDLNGLTVLIGENGTGKSSVVEACELLRRLTNQNFWSEFNNIHGGEAMLLRRGAGEITLGVEVASETWKAGYSIAFGKSGISTENLWVTPGLDLSVQIMAVERTGPKALVKLVFPSDDKQLNSQVAQINRTQTPLQRPLIASPTLHAIGPIFEEVHNALRDIDVQLPFITTPYWVGKSLGGRQTSQMRDSVTLTATTQLDRHGDNLANAYYTLRNDRPESEWNYAMELVRLGLGQWVESVKVRADAGAGKVAIWIKAVNVDKEIPAASLSDGQLSYLAFVALTMLSVERSLFVFDEIESHLHPRMVTRVMSLIRTISDKCPVLLTTHSRRILDELENPSESVRVLELDQEQLRTTQIHFDREKLETWLEEYEGVGKLLDAGYSEDLFAQSTSKDR